jgi:hypothetical protein
LKLSRRKKKIIFLQKVYQGCGGLGRRRQQAVNGPVAPQGYLLTVLRHPDISSNVVDSVPCPLPHHHSLPATCYFYTLQRTHEHLFKV